MEQQLLLAKKLKKKLNTKGRSQTRPLKLSMTKGTKNSDAKLKGNSLDTNDIVMLFDCADIVFKGWNFYEDSVYQSVLLPVI